MTDFANDAWRRAQTSLASAARLIPDDPDSAASLAYYAAFYALSAIFALRGRSFSKHTEIRAALHRDLIRQGSLPAQIGRDYDYLLAARETGSYGGPAHVSADDAREAVHKAQACLAAIARICPELRLD